ncbi:SHOCT domain-containing protein [Microbacterium sp. B2969]|uniref:SHOCT domain-containing protein n=1 Tax=Microbacterium alkaliflavum TaxID=3248839 RepID=A0ABW7Q5Q8_9MICO
MMWGWGLGGWWMWASGAILLLVLVAGFVIAIVLLARLSRPGDGHAADQRRLDDSAYRMLESRLAGGEITTDEFRALSLALEEGAARRRAAA